MYIADKAFSFFIKTLFVITIVIVVIVIIFNSITCGLNFEDILLGILGKFVDLIRSLFGISYDALSRLINNFELP
jgi:hypothetical protein